MKAAVLRRHKEPLQLEELAVEAPHVGEVAVKVAATGVCHSDLYVLEGATPVPPPLVPGHEAVGVVEEVGPGVDGLSPGDYVVTSSYGRAAVVKTAPRAEKIFAKTSPR